MARALTRDEYYAQVATEPAPANWLDQHAANRTRSLAIRDGVLKVAHKPRRRNRRKKYLR